MVGDVDELTEEKLQKMILASGRNVGSWAPGELDALVAAGGVKIVSIAEYKAWFDALPADFRQPVLA